MKYILILIVVLISLSSCGNHYSPVDTYIQGTIAADSANRAAKAEAQKFIDSINLKK